MTYGGHLANPDAADEQPWRHPANLLVQVEQAARFLHGVEGADDEPRCGRRRAANATRSDRGADGWNGSRDGQLHGGVGG
jgi:hypothetical protein